MTTPDQGSSPGDPERGPADGPSADELTVRGRGLGGSTFTIEGRSAPALFVVGWLASLLGFGLCLVAVLSSGGPAALGLLVVGLVLLAIGLVAAAGSQGIERRARGVATYAGPSPLLVFAASLPISVLASLLLVALPLELAGVPTNGPLAALVSVGIQAVVYLGLIRLLVVDTGALDWRGTGLRPLGPAAVGELIGGAVWALPVIVVTAWVSSVLLQVFPVDPVSPLPRTGETVGFALSLLAGAVVAPIGEEIFFRGFVTTAWVRDLGAGRGIIRAALVFAFAHVVTTTGATTGEAFGLAVVGFGTRIPIALALGWLFVKRGSIWAPIGLHAAFNAVLLVIAEAAEPTI